VLSTQPADSQNVLNYVRVPSDRLREPKGSFLLLFGLLQGMRFDPYCSVSSGILLGAFILIYKAVECWKNSIEVSTFNDTASF